MRVYFIGSCTVSEILMTIADYSIALEQFAIYQVKYCNGPYWCCVANLLVN